ncbi:hypothetical protein [Pontibacter roseus]|uniref:hypothetical protein n=1 Tax=Pontibacter roseus TaxID=336989 RepID=UPI00037E3CA4|nr:hypothetical protein [Pontibacter roseus]
MKFKVLLLSLLLASAFTASAQDTWAPKIGYGGVMAGNGDLPGHWFLAGVQKQVSSRSGFEIAATGTYIEQTRDWGQGYETFEKSNGMALEGTYNYFLSWGAVRLYPAVGPVLRYASERDVNQLSISYNSQGEITEFAPVVHTNRQLQPGVVVALNLDVRATQHLTLGLRGAVQSFQNGQRLASVGITLQNLNWGF